MLGQVGRLPELLEYERGWPPGHFYSPIPSLEDVRRHEARIFAAPPRRLPGIHLDEPGQLAFLRRISRHHPTLAFSRDGAGGRFTLENPNFANEAVVLQCVIREARPSRIVEVGSGYSSCAILDTNDLFFDRGISCTFVEPHPELLRSLLRPGDEAHATIVPRPLQEAPDEVFAALGAGDLLVIDSTHVAKIDSDVNHLLFRVLPALASGVLVHVHDIYYPFEYPRSWVMEGRAWNEAYALRAFLQFNEAFDIVLFNSFISTFHAQEVEAVMPGCGGNLGSSLWLRRR